MDAAAAEDTRAQDQPLFTCLSCSLGFLTAEQQRIHYRSDHHRYNMKRRVASLPPVSVAVFNQKVLERRQETAVMSPAKGSRSKKTYTNVDEVSIASVLPTPEPEAAPSVAPSARLTVDDDATEDAINQAIDEKIAAARSQISSNQCLFCSQASSSLEDNLTHMSAAHSFFIPDADYLIDLPGLINYLGEKIVVGNVCIFCNGKGREFRTLHAVRKHMLDKSHCKIAYDTENEKLEISDYYDFSSSYPDADSKKRPKADRLAKKDGDVGEEEWEDLDDDGSDKVDEIVDEASDSSSEDDSDSDSLPDNDITYGDSHLELVLPSGARIGHRSMRRYYAQSFPGNFRGSKAEDPNSGAALVRRLLADKNSALVPRKGGFGAFGIGTEVVKARNRGEAREAGRHVREFRDQKRREDFKTKVGFIGNHQKHFRDPLLQ